ncbi:MAG: chemotaxis protein CheA [Candidatus Protochlamydia sp.]|nr:chemotaxis protein CheA [Candidatus Protochlamydia sp.]
MKQNENSNSLFIKNELQAHANILKVTLSQIKQKSSNNEVIEMALKSFQLMSSILQITQLKPLIPLFQTLHELFENISDPALIEEKWLDALFSISKNLIQLSTLPEPTFEKEILAKEETINQWTSQVSQVLAEIKQRSPHPQPEQAQSVIKDVTDRSDSLKMDEALILFFLKELQIQARKLREDVTLHISDPFLDAPLKDWAQTARGIKQAADIIKLNPIVQVAETLEHYAQALLEHKIKLSQENEEICFKIIEALQNLSHLEPDHVSFFINERQNKLLELNHYLSFNLQNFSLKEDLPKHEQIKKVFVEQKALLSEPPLGDSMFDLFRNEMDRQCRILNQKLIEFEEKRDPVLLGDMMRAAHSIKGAARTLFLAPVAKMAHAMEDCFVNAQIQKKNLSNACIDCLFQVIDFFTQIGELEMPRLSEWANTKTPLVDKLINDLIKTYKGEVKNAGDFLLSDYLQSERPYVPPSEIKEDVKKIEVKTLISEIPPERTLRVTAENLNRLMGMAGESLIESHRLYPLSENLQKMKTELIYISNLFDNFLRQVSETELTENSKQYLLDLLLRINHNRSHLTEDLVILDSFIQRHENLSDRLYHEVINSRMRPFSDGVEGFPRLVRDLAKQLDKKVKFEIEGFMTQVDRDVLEKLETPLTHLLRNAIDHGIELPKERIQAGKPFEGLISLKAYHTEGLLGITITDDGRGIDVENIRKKIVEKGLADNDAAKQYSESEVIDFLFMPGFSTSKEITELSGRGVGLDIVRSAVLEMGGVVRISLNPGRGVAFDLLLPLTLSVIRALLVKISGEVYAFPLTRISRALLINKQEIKRLENRQFFWSETQNIGIFSAWQLLELQESHTVGDQLHLVVLSDRSNSYGVVVDLLIGEKELVLQKLDSRLGEIPDIAAGALMEDGSPVLVINVEELMQSCESLRT